MANSDDPLMTTGQVAHRLNVSVSTIRRMTRARELTKIGSGRFIRYRTSEVEALIERGRSGGVASSAQAR